MSNKNLVKLQELSNNHHYQTDDPIAHHTEHLDYHVDHHSHRANIKMNLNDHPWIRDVLRDDMNDTETGLKAQDEELKIKKKEYEISPYFLMCGFILRRFERFKVKFALIDQCEEIIEKMSDVDYDFKKKFEQIYMKKYLFNENPEEISFFRYNVKTVNFSRNNKSTQFLKELQDEFNTKISRTMLRNCVNSGTKGLHRQIEHFEEYHME